MGMDFVALVRYHRTGEVVRRIAALEHQTRPISSEVASLGGAAVCAAALGALRVDCAR